MQADLEAQNSAFQKIKNQTSLSAALGAAFWSMPILVLWAFIYQLKPGAGIAMLIISGVLIGLAVRIHGRGYERIFAFIGVLAHFCVVFSALQLDMLLGGNVLAVIVVGVYIVGAWCAMYFSRINIPFHEHKAFDSAFESGEYQQQKQFKNRWFVVLPLVTGLSLATGFLTVLSVIIFKENKAIEFEQAYYDEQAEQFRNKHINTDDETLAGMSIKKALTYAYAYYSGRHFDEKGQYHGDFPQDSFQAEVILRYLADKQSDPRAQFILGRLINNDRGQALLLQAEEAGDKFARLFAIYNFGCLVDAKQGRQLLTSFDKHVQEQAIINDIQMMLSDDFKSYCDELDNNTFDYRYIRHYKPAE